jgi:hypothetical protein
MNTNAKWTQVCCVFSFCVSGAFIMFLLVVLAESPEGGFLISQPGSSAITSLSPGEAVEKYVFSSCSFCAFFPQHCTCFRKVAILEIKKEDYRLVSVILCFLAISSLSHLYLVRISFQVPLNTIRPFLIDAVKLSEHLVGFLRSVSFSFFVTASPQDKDATIDDVENFLAKKVQEMVDTAHKKQPLTGNKEQDKYRHPLIRLKVPCPSPILTSTVTVPTVCFGSFFC